MMEIICIDLVVNGTIIINIFFDKSETIIIMWQNEE